MLFLRVFNYFMERRLKEKLPDGKFVGVSPVRSKAMAAVRGKGNKTTEWRLRMALVRSGLTGWTLHPKNILGHPDFFFPEAQLAVFVDGCFWHGCPICGHIPKTNNDYWKEKIMRNRERDIVTNEHLTLHGVKVVRFWEHQLTFELCDCVAVIKDELDKSLE